MLHIYGPLRPSWTASHAWTRTRGADKGAPQLDRQQSWDRNAGSRQRSLPVGPPAELGQERWEATQECTVAESSGAAPRLGRPRVRRAVRRAARLRAARRAPTLPLLLHGEQERRPRRGESHLSAAVACGRSSALVWGRACVLVAAGTAARPCSERHHRRDLRPHHRARRRRGRVVVAVRGRRTALLRCDGTAVACGRSVALAESLPRAIRAVRRAARLGTPQGAPASRRRAAQP